ncbi:response regulator transcription factor [Aneurinibacillus aneurinilyticus]|uniref:Putative response regulator protein GraR n=1 Tax=Aneurinibacillus aneurinilyticus ATCC 12856 TaxID=649747 RepID=U1YEY4_ANEAE|nr:response regulator transcription factor [Aneurinibacillus aneurinilyticus]ERI10652.1 putative response regulator protein GraR [Aneurinibacillus aneurinilyticus ATCC 12856]MED0705802.1 response regulator transcription factor [Aneurinibacillus aneurinilyticus]MED0722876.1 response regulator transcription factor [Aneurinibacillus aneurinilyticus]MED0734790.1 response regulator transcription factor [Aneurinibacillus aneurinilyticus]MED0743731.1 response regulator transcription factor [Aneurinib
MYKILIVEDEVTIANTLKNHLEKYGYDCHTVVDFEKVLDVFQDVEPHLVIMDINLPAFDGYYWSRKIRRVSNCPIMILSARMSELDQVYGIENGADDFITKPFLMDVVLAKINGQIRRVYGEYAKKPQTRILKKGNTALNLDTVRLSTSEQEELLTVKELQLCAMLFKAFPNVVTRQQLLTAIWDDEAFVEENTLTVNIVRLRKKFEAIHSSLEITTIRGIGYQLTEKSL